MWKFSVITFGMIGVTQFHDSLGANFPSNDKFQHKQQTKTAVGTSPKFIIEFNAINFSSRRSKITKPDVHPLFNFRRSFPSFDSFPSREQKNNCSSGVLTLLRGVIYAFSTCTRRFKFS